MLVSASTGTIVQFCPVDLAAVVASAILSKHSEINTSPCGNDGYASSTSTLGKLQYSFRLGGGQTFYQFIDSICDSHNLLRFANAQAVYPLCSRWRDCRAGSSSSREEGWSLVWQHPPNAGGAQLHRSSRSRGTIEIVGCAVTKTARQHGDAGLYPTGRVCP